MDDEMQVEKFDKDQHYDQVVEWFKLRNLNPPPVDLLSTNGVIVRNVACGFLYSTDSSMAILDFYISNPKSRDRMRAKALETITSNLLIWAKEMGVRVIVTNSQVKTIQKLAHDFDFKSFGFSHVFMKEL